MNAENPHPEPDNIRIDRALRNLNHRKDEWINESEADHPSENICLYRYRGANAIKRIIEFHPYGIFPKIYLAPPNELNDPYDAREPNTLKTSIFFRECMVDERITTYNASGIFDTQTLRELENDFRATLLYADWDTWVDEFAKTEEKYSQRYSTKKFGIKQCIKAQSVQVHECYVKDSSKWMGVASFSETPHSMLMWSHYADSHKGICLEYPVSKIPTVTEGAITGFVSQLSPVNYDNGIMRAIYNQWNRYRDDDPSMTQDEIYSLLDITGLTKAKDWEYEKEWRLVARFNPDGLSEDDVDINRLVPVYPSKIILGAKISAVDEKKLRRIGKAHDIPVTKMYLNEQEYRLEEKM